VIQVNVFGGNLPHLRFLVFRSAVAPPNIISIVKRKMRWVRHIACMGQMRNVTLSGRDGRITFKWNLKD
jgi:hypothetical protein